MFYYKINKGGEYKLKGIWGIKNKKFKVKWKGYPKLKNIWELLKNLIKYERKVHEYL